MQRETDKKSWRKLNKNFPLKVINLQLKLCFKLLMRDLVLGSHHKKLLIENLERNSLCPVTDSLTLVPRSFKTTFLLLVSNYELLKLFMTCLD